MLKIETSEVNRVFLAAMSASNSAFVKKLRPFQTAVETHVIEAIYSNRNTASTADIRVNTDTQLLSFIGFDVDNGQFGDYAKLGARITATDDQTGLENSLKSLLEADITKLEAK